MDFSIFNIHPSCILLKLLILWCCCYYFSRIIGLINKSFIMEWDRYRFYQNFRLVQIQHLENIHRYQGALWLLVLWIKYPELFCGILYWIFIGNNYFYIIHLSLIYLHFFVINSLWWIKLFPYVICWIQKLCLLYNFFDEYNYIKLKYYFKMLIDQCMMWKRHLTGKMNWII